MGAKSWDLVADIGGTNARFGLKECAAGNWQVVKRYSVSEHREFAETLTHFLSDVSEQGEWQYFPRAACLALACPVEGKRVQFTNSPWSIDRLTLSAQLNNIYVELINDFTAIAHAVPELKPNEWHQVGGTSPVPDRPVVILGPGTGLGVSSLVPIDSGFRVIEGEGGHVDFAPIDSREIAVLEILTARFGSVSVERLLSGYGIMNIYRALGQLGYKETPLSSPFEVTDAALAGIDTLAVNTLSMFCRILGSVSGNLALTLGAKGGVYIAGGIVPGIVTFLEKSDFYQRFVSKGRFRDYLADIPVRIILKENMGLIGAANKLHSLSS